MIPTQQYSDVHSNQKDWNRLYAMTKARGLFLAEFDPNRYEITTKGKRKTLFVGSFEETAKFLATQPVTEPGAY